MKLPFGEACVIAEGSGPDTFELSGSGTLDGDTISGNFELRRMSGTGGEVYLKSGDDFITAATVPPTPITKAYATVGDSFLTDGSGSHITTDDASFVRSIEVNVEDSQGAPLQVSTDNLIYLGLWQIWDSIRGVPGSMRVDAVDLPSADASWQPGGIFGSPDGKLRIDPQKFFLGGHPDALEVELAVKGEYETDSLIGQWNLDGDAGDAVGGNSGNINGSAAWSADTPSGLSQSNSFAATNGDISIPNVGGWDGTDLTIAAWCKLDSAGDGMGIAVGSSAFRLGFSGRTRIPRFLHGTTNIESRGPLGGPVDFDRWVHLCGTWNRTTNEIRLFVDGRIAAGGVGNGGDPTELTIGARAPGAQNVRGNVCFVRLWNRVLTHLEVKADAQFGGFAVIPSPVVSL